ncbi:hypothetical protein LINPERPRIM_LOCUS26396, partial [Linum perenne]
MSDNPKASMDRDLEALRLLEEDDEGLLLPEEELFDVEWLYEYCLIRFIPTRKQYNFNIMKNQMASIWQPGRGVHNLNNGFFSGLVAKALDNHI